MVLRRTVCGEAVERSAGRRRTVDSSLFHRQESNNGRLITSTSAPSLYTLTDAGEATADPNRPS